MIKQRCVYMETRSLGKGRYAIEACTMWSECGVPNVPQSWGMAFLLQKNKRGDVWWYMYSNHCVVRYSYKTQRWHLQIDPKQPRELKEKYAKEFAALNKRTKEK